MLKMFEMELNKEGIIKNINVSNDIKRRFMDIGIVPNVKVIRVLEDYTKTISAYQIMDALIAIRNKDTEGIEVSYE